MALVEAIYKVTRAWPPSEMYGLTGQVRRAAVSIPANIAEGQGRTGSREFLHHLSIASGSLREVETHLLIGHRLGYLEESACNTLLRQTDEIGRIMLGLIRSLRTSQ
jgi:four helix bundle protein